MHMSKTAKQWKHDASWLIRQAIKQYKGPYDGTVCYLLYLEATTNRHRDADGCVKLTQDCLENSGLIVNDCQVKDFRVIYRVTGQPEMTRIWVWAGDKLPDDKVREIVDGIYGERGRRVV